MPHTHSQSTSTSSPYPRPTRLPRSPSDPIHLSYPSPTPASRSPLHSPLRGPSPGPAAGQQIYVLTADGSSLFLVDPSKPRGGEEPPPYASFPVQPLPLAGDDDADADAEEPGVRRVEFPSVDEEGPHRHRARTLSAISNQERYRPRTSTFTRPPASRRARSALSTPEPRTAWLVPDETTPLLPSRDLEYAPIADEGAGWIGRGWWRDVWCGELEDGEEDTRVGWGEGWRRYWRPVGRSAYWGSVLHLVFLNFPFALLVWPWLLVGTLAGTALLITLPLGAIVWWLTLIISRSAARLETIMQLHYHTPLPPGKTAQYHPIFYRPLPVPRSSSPYYTPLPSPSSHPHPHPYHTAPPPPLPPTFDPSPIIWDKRFTKNSYAMFLDHYSYSALSYFLLVKPLLTLFGTIMCILVLALGVGTLGVGLPVAMRIVRRWGRWQGEVALDNL
ncbi:hypothetical protein I350_04500 [Cryptococcus amylolentus CBS 6273]|uniref:Uncharacterized protein n=1 Tax=Cryptococcus amylolentus CBS 6273 TaxID=1296118 RepID=A0A1E3K1X6_9TREE|nr:hypothetical protein I350_04500 [Cryptococcus amylolentus CBS 6273]